MPGRRDLYEYMNSKVEVVLCARCTLRAVNADAERLGFPETVIFRFIE